MVDVFSAHRFTPGRPLARDLKRLRADLLAALRRMGVPGAADEADAILRDVSQALVEMLLSEASVGSTSSPNSNKRPANSQCSSTAGTLPPVGFRASDV
jgi:hypothetical protein